MLRSYFSPSIVTATSALADSRTLSPSTSATQAFVDEVVMALVAAFAAVLLRHLDAAAFDLIDRADVDTVGPDNFHMFLDFFHWQSPDWCAFAAKLAGHAAGFEDGF